MRGPPFGPADAYLFPVHVTASLSPRIIKGGDCTQP
jgi:hypothetical protein